MDRLLTADEVAARLAVPKTWVWARARADEIPCVRLGRYRRFRESAVEEWSASLSKRRSIRVGALSARGRSASLFGHAGDAPGWGPGGRRFKSCLPDSNAAGDPWCAAV